MATLFCDQGTNFVGANSELKQALAELDHDRLTRLLASSVFKFKVPHECHHGGVWESQIRTVRNSLKSVIELANVHLDDSSLRTFSYEATYIVNSRPLSTVSVNDPLAEPPITPNALLHGNIEGICLPLAISVLKMLTHESDGRCLHTKLMEESAIPQ